MPTVKEVGGTEPSTDSIGSEDAGCFETNSNSVFSNLVPITEEHDKIERISQQFNSEYVNGLMDRWRKAARRARIDYVDPWNQFNIQIYPIMKAKRHRYSAIRKQWTEDFVEVRLHPEPFARGAMRECYRLKKLSSMGGSSDWAHAQNYVAKKYMQNVDRKVIFEDVKLQMDAKLWAEEYNRHKPPKKIDIVQMCVIEIIDMAESPLFHLEHFIEGKYLKYNSNSGFVSNDARLTPQAFSHFTFERSGHQMMIVDIQGVGDLYTDPQIHTVIGTDYGDGNLGTRGMALFFRSHKCNYICRSMDLSEFQLSENETEELKNERKHLVSTTCYNRNRHISESCVPVDDNISMEALRRVTLSISRESSSTNDHDENCLCVQCIPVVDLENNTCDSEDNRSVTSSLRRSTSKSMTGDNDEDETNYIPRKVAFHDLRVVRPDSQYLERLSINSSLDAQSMISSRLTGETEGEDFWKNARKMTIPANITLLNDFHNSGQAELKTRQFSILGQIHVDLARYHELGRFVEGKKNSCAFRELDTDHMQNHDISSSNYDKESAIFHLEVARKCGILEAVLTSASIVKGMPHELLKDITVEEYLEEIGCDDMDIGEFGMELMECAAEMGDKGAMLYMAKAYETGQNLGNVRSTNYKKSIEWYQRVVGFQDEDNNENCSVSPMARHEVLAKMAEMYMNGGYGIEQDFERAYNLYTEAADAAMENMNGKLANKYYEKAAMCEV